MISDLGNISRVGTKGQHEIRDSGLSVFPRQSSEYTEHVGGAREGGPKFTRYGHSTGNLTGGPVPVRQSPKMRQALAWYLIVRRYSGRPSELENWVKLTNKCVYVGAAVKANKAPVSCRSYFWPGDYRGSRVPREPRWEDVPDFPATCHLDSRNTPSSRRGLSSPLEILGVGVLQSQGNILALSW